MYFRRHRRDGLKIRALVSLDRVTELRHTNEQPGCDLVVRVSKVLGFADISFAF